MSSKWNTLTKKNSIIFLSLCITGFWILLIYAKTGIVFETNDDRYISEILSGTLTGSPEAHTTYVNYLLCLPLTLLYHISGKIAWYGWMLVLCQVICYASLCYLFLKNWGILSLPVSLGILFSGFYITGLLQYTSTSALLAVTGYVCCYLIQDPKKKWGLFFFFELLAFLLRRQAMLMIQPIGMLTLLGLMLADYITCTKANTKETAIPDAHTNIEIRKTGSFWNTYVRSSLLPISITILAIFIGLFGNALGYHDAGWKEYLRFNEARTEMFDYYGAPDYDSAQTILERYQITKAQYQAFCNFTILEENLSADCLRELADLAKEQYNSNQAISDWIHAKNCLVSSVKGYFYDEHWKINGVLLVLWILLLITIFSFRRFSLLIPTVGLLAGRIITWTYLLFCGRVPDRVAVPMYMCEIILLVVILWTAFKKVASTELFSSQNQTSLRKGTSVLSAVMLLSATLFLAASFKSALIQYHYVKEQNQSQQIYVESFPELQEYCSSHPENHYLIEAQSLGYYRGNALSPMLYQPRNSLVTGCWYSSSPQMMDTLDEYIGSAKKENQVPGKEPLYFIVADGQEDRVEPILTYLSEYTGHAGTLSDQFTVSHGGTYLVYCYQ